MTDLLARSPRTFVLDVTVDGHPVVLHDEETGTFATPTEALDALARVFDQLRESGLQMKNLNLLAEGGWVAVFQHYGGPDPSVWRATYREQGLPNDSNRYAS